MQNATRMNTFKIYSSGKVGKLPVEKAGNNETKELPAISDVVHSVKKLSEFSEFKANKTVRK